MKTAIKTTVTAIFFSILVSISSTSFASDRYSNSEQAREGDIIVDLLLARPLGAVGSFLGFTTHVVGLLFSVPGENFSETAEILVEEPLNYTFNRPLGHFDDNR